MVGVWTISWIITGWAAVIKFDEFKPVLNDSESMSLLIAGFEVALWLSYGVTAALAPTGNANTDAAKIKTLLQTFHNTYPQSI